MGKLKQYLIASGMTQKDLAERLGVSQPTISDWLRNVTFPSSENLREICKITGLSADDLLCGHTDDRQALAG